MKHTWVHKAPRNPQQRFRMSNGPEVVREVGAFDVGVASDQRLFDFDLRLADFAVRPGCVLPWWKLSFEHRFEHERLKCDVHPSWHGPASAYTWP